MDPICFNCKNNLIFQRSQGAFECVNTNCEVNGLLQLCEICGEYSLTGTPMQCVNSACPSYHKPRTSCPDCKMTSLITVNRMPVCLNSDCSRNQGLERCWFCEQQTLSKAQQPQKIVVCRNNECQASLKLIRACPICSQNSFDLHQGRCLNTQCPSKGVQVTTCPACEKKRYFGDPETREYLCTNTKCELHFKNNPNYQEQIPIQTFQPPVFPSPFTNFEQNNTEDLGAQTLTMNPMELQEVIAGTRPSEIPTINEDVPTLKRMQADKPESETKSSDENDFIKEKKSDAPEVPVLYAERIQDKPETEQSKSDKYPQKPKLKGKDKSPSDSADDGELEIEVDMEQDATFEDAYRYLQKTMLAPPGEEPAPLYLMLGLAGVGKTCYLSMLGQVLQGQQFYTPRSDIRPQMVHIEQRYQDFVSDLVYGYSTEKFQQYLSRGNWPPADKSDSARKFLVTQLVLPDGSIAKLVTLEIRGEVYEEFLPEIVQIFHDAGHLKRLKPEHKIIWELIKQAEGIVILFDVTNALLRQSVDSKLSIFVKFFQAVAQWKEIEVKKKLNYLFQLFTEYVDSEQGHNNFFLTKIIATHKRRIGPKTFDEFADDITKTSNWLINQLTEKGINTSLENEDFKFKLLKLWSAYQRAKLPIDQAMAKLNEMLQERFSGRLSTTNGSSDDQIANFLSDFLKMFAKKSVLDKLYNSEFDAGSIQISQWWPIFIEYLSSMVQGQLDPAVLRPLDTSNVSLESKHSKVFFDKLKYMAITFTKTDRDYAIYPASNFPNLVDMNLAEKLRMLSTYLTILDGYLKFYNGSVSGYSVMKDGNYAIGEGATLTPINVAEPFLDMLSHRMQTRENLERLLFTI